jgi:tetrahydromethanopterin S-methyltransferase subunit G
MTELKKLHKQLAKLEKQYDNVNVKATVKVARIMKKAESIQRRIDELTE